MRLILGTTMLAVVMFAIGCEGNISPTPDTAGTAPAPPAPTPPGDPNQMADESADLAADDSEAPEADGTPEAAAPPIAETPEEAQPPVADASDPAQPADDDGGTSEVATAASGAKGRDYEAGFITTPIQQYFRAESRINLLNMANALKIYKAGHNDKGPKTHDEFMEVIVKENGINLPELPAGEVYAYDPKTEQLMVRQPKE